MKVTRSDDDNNLLLELTAEEQVFLEKLARWATAGGEAPEDVIKGAAEFLREYEVVRRQIAE